MRGNTLSENSGELLDRIQRRASELFFRLGRHYRHLHQNPEMSWQETATADYIESVLRELGYAPQRAAGTGLVLDIEASAGGSGESDLARRGLRCDLDAIAVEEETDLEYASENPGVMHACGHDAHSSILLGLAELLLDIGPRRPLRLIWQPAEEVLPSGSQKMIDEGVLEGLEDIITLHVWPALPTGVVGLRDGPITAAADLFICTLHGPGGHGARPYETVDLIALSSKLVDEMLDIPRRALHPEREPAVLSFGVIQAGESPNVLPSELRLVGTVRTLSQTAREKVHGAMREVVADLCRLAGATSNLEIRTGPPAVHNDAGLVQLAREQVGALYGEEAIAELELPSMGSEDFGHYLEHIPGLLLRLGCTAVDEPMFGLHASRFRVDENALPIGVATLAALGCF